MDPEVAKAHIALYVTEFTRDLGPEGIAAVRRLLGPRRSAPQTSSSPSRGARRPAGRRRRAAAWPPSGPPRGPGTAPAQRVRGVVEHLDDVLDDDHELVGGLAHRGHDGRRVSSRCRFSALSPRRPSATPNSTRCPGLRWSSGRQGRGVDVDIAAVIPRDKSVTLSALYHLTLPVGTGLPHPSVVAWNSRSETALASRGSGDVLRVT